MKGKIFPVALVICLLLLLVPASSGEWNRVTRLTYSGSAENQEVMVDSEDNIHIIYQESSGGHHILKYTKLDDRGVRVVPARTITHGTGDSLYPAAALDSSGIYLVWWNNREGDYKLYYTFLNHNGTRKTNDKPLTPDMANDRTPAEAPRVALDSDGNLFVVWSQYGKGMNNMMDNQEFRFSVFVMKIDRTGDIIFPSVRISTGYANGINPDVVVDGSECAHVVWSEDITGNYEIYYTMVQETGHPMDPDIVRLTDSPMESVMSRLLLHTGNLYLAWSDGEDTGEMYSVHFGRITITGLAYDLKISGNGNALYPSIDSDGSRIFISWQDDRHSLEGSEGREAYKEVKENLSTIKSYINRHLFGEQDFDSGDAITNWEIYFSILDGNGRIFENNSRITTMKRASRIPEISVDSSGAVRIVWMDMSQSSGDLYYLDNTVTESKEKASTINPDEESLILLSGVGILVIIYLLSGEGRRYTLFRFFLAPLYSTISRERLLENENRRQIIALISAKEGITFTSLMEELGLKNGALAYHLYTLERQRYIKSVKDGKYRRFYPRGARITGLSSQEEKILRIIKSNPSITQREISKLIDSTPQTVNYNIKKLISRRVVYLKKDGKHTRCHLTNPES